MKIKHIALAITFMFFSVAANSQSKVGTVNINDILTKMPELTEVENSLKVYQEELDKTLNDKVLNYKNKVELFKKNSDSYSDIMKKTMSQELFELENDIKQFQVNGRKLAQVRQEELLKPLYHKINQTVVTLAKKQGYSQILTREGNEFAYADPKLDITSVVKLKLGIKE